MDFLVRILTFILTLCFVALAEQPRRTFQLDYPAFSAATAMASSKEKTDPFTARNWALVNIGFFDSFTYLINPILPTTKRCSPGVIVAVIDTGIDYTHPELASNLWINTGETGSWNGSKDCRDKNCNNIDDDGNGFKDDLLGWDFVHDVPLPYDSHGHGTHISGIIGAAAANGIGGTGVCPNVSIMPLKYYDNGSAGYNNLNNTVRAIQYAVKMGAHIINYSGGGSDPSPAERKAIAEAQTTGILFVAAAGNEGRNNDRIPYYPASYGFDNIISVASLNKKNELLDSSNYGKTVHVAAPGYMIYSTLPESKFGVMTGTSQATAFVTGVAALLVSQFDDDPRKHYKEVRQAILDSAKPLKNNELHSLVSYGVLNVPKSLEFLKKIAKTKK